MILQGTGKEFHGMDIHYALRMMSLNTQSPANGTILGSCRTFRRWGLVGGMKWLEMNLQPLLGSGLWLSVFSLWWLGTSFFTKARASATMSSSLWNHMLKSTLLSISCSLSLWWTHCAFISAGGSTSSVYRNHVWWWQSPSVLLVCKRLFLLHYHRTALLDKVFLADIFFHHLNYIAPFLAFKTSFEKSLQSDGLSLCLSQCVSLLMIYWVGWLLSGPLRVTDIDRSASHDLGCLQ